MMSDRKDKIINILGQKRPRCFQGIESGGIIWSEYEWINMRKAVRVNPLNIKNDGRYIEKYKNVVYVIKD